MDLVISVREGGNLQALSAQKITNQVPGSRTVLQVVEEGTQITEEDVRQGRILIRLDSKDIEDRIQQMQITLENSKAAYTEAQENLLIQKKQNESDLRAAELKVRFAKLDLEKYLGSTLTEELLKKPEMPTSELLASPHLGGEALNKKRQCETNIDLAKEEVARAADRATWSEQLAEKGYVTKTELEADKLALQQKEVSLEQARLSADLFFRYDFRKQVERLYSDYLEALADLERTKAKCQARLIQAEANVRNRQATHLLNLTSMRDLQEQLKNCTIVASKPGFVVYATSDRPWRTDAPIQPGTTIRQNQDLLTLPDFNSMGVVVKIHESAIDRVKIGQKAKVIVDAFPDKLLTGVVKNIALMPDPTLKFLNPDLNVYVAQIALDQVYDYLKPGMSAQVEILVNQLSSVLAVPVAAISFQGEDAFCRILQGARIIEQKVSLGESNEQYIEIKSGLKEG
ncbi:MAG: efflux RND transporter periplasmic adaptor subunit, partial [Candidatus Omnitrophica bacterium]|nr:efflux RND transporter periplasmic adaptor subunit [Candidatus Omnitrophota bacterium]